MSSSDVECTTHAKEHIVRKILDKKFAYYAAVLELSIIEREKMLAQAPLKEVLSQMKKKQILLDCIDQIEKELLSLKSYKKTKVLSSAAPTPLKQQVSDLDRLLQKVLSLSQSNQILFESSYLEMPPLTIKKKMHKQS